MTIEQLREWVEAQMNNAETAAKAAWYPPQENMEVGQFQAFKAVLTKIDTYHSEEEEG